MSWIRLPEPGSENGPCTDEACAHEDCRWTRQIAALECMFCEQPIGYGRQTTRHGGQWVHFGCLVEAVEQEQAAEREEALRR